MKIKVDFAGAEKQMRKAMLSYQRQLKLDIEDVVVEKAAVMGRALANATEPFGLGEKAENIALNAVSGDFHKVNMSKAHVASLIGARSRRKMAAYLTALTENRWARADRIAQSALGSEIRVGKVAIIQNQLNSKGRVGNAHIPVMVDNYADALAYKKKVMATAGTAKAAWLQSISDIRAKGSRKPKKWLRTNPSYGTSKVVRDNFKTHVILENKISYLNNILSHAKVKRAVLQGSKNFLRVMKRKVEANWKKQFK
jgi:hypothetical protein